MENLLPVIIWHLNLWWVNDALIFDSYSNHVEEEGMRPAFSDSEVTPQDVPPGTAGFPGGGWEGTGQHAGSSLCGQKKMGLGVAGRGAVFWPFLSGSLSPGPRLWNMFWKLLPEDTHPVGDSLFLESQCKCLDSDDIQGCVSRPIIWLVTEV